MEYCAARCPFDPEVSTDFEAYDVYKDPGGELVIAALHVIYLLGMDNSSAAHTLFKLRTSNLVKYVVDALGDRKDEASVKAALENAFTRVDAETAALASKLKCEEMVESLKTKYNCEVVVVTGGHVFIAGSGASTVYVMGGGDYRDGLSGTEHASLASSKRSNESVLEMYHDLDESSPLFYFHKEALRVEDEFVVLVSFELLRNIPPSVGLAALLVNRISVLGLERACRSIVGPLKDASKIIIVVDLNKPSSTKPMRYSGECDYTRGKSKYPLSFDPERIASDDKMILVEDPLAYLLLLDNGHTEQIPLPQTTRSYHVFNEMSRPCEHEISTKVSGGLAERERRREKAGYISWNSFDREFPSLPFKQLEHGRDKSEKTKFLWSKHSLSRML